VASNAFYEAYVEVVPTAKGFERSLNKQLAGPSAGAGTTAGGAAGMGFVGAFGKAIPIIGGVLAAAGIGNMIESAINDAGTYQQAQGAVEDVFGKLGSDAIKAFAEGGAQSVGQSMNDILQSSSLLGIFGRAAGLADGELVDFSTNLITLGADLSAFANTSPEEAVEALAAGLRGESEPLRKYGVLLDDATLKARAMEMGIYDGNGPLTQQQRILAAYSEILAQTATQQGTFAEESDTLAGSQARIAASWENISTKIGTAFLPIAEDLAEWFLEKGIPALEDFAGWLNSPETQQGFDNFGKGLQSIGGFFQGFSDALANGQDQVFTFFQEFSDNLLNGQNQVFSFFGAIGAAFANGWSQIATFFGQVGGAFANGARQIGQFAADVSRNVGNIISWFASLPGRIGQAIGNMGSLLFSAGRQVIQGFVNGITSMVSRIYSAITSTVGGAIDWAKDLLGIQSPSKVFHQIGEYTSQGFARGIESEFGRVRVATAGMTSAAAEGVSFDGASIGGLLEIGGDGLARIIDGRIFSNNSQQARIDNAGRRRL
jgi:hypothetical protein